MAQERLYIVAYDISDQKRWRRIFKTLRGYGTWVQLSIFQCRLTARRRAELAHRLDELIRHNEDHVILMDLGPAESVEPRVESLGKTFTAQKREAIIV